MTITGRSALEHLELLYSLNGIGKTANGDFVISCDTGWAAYAPEEAAKDLADNLEAVDAIRARICELGGGGFRLPDPDIIVENSVFGFNEKNLSGDPVAKIPLNDGSVIDITHKEFALDLDEQYFLFKHIRDDIIEKVLAGGLADIAPTLEKVITECGLASCDSFCPACGEQLGQEERDTGFSEWTCPRCGCMTTVFHQSGHAGVESPEGFSSFTEDWGSDKSSMKVLLFMEELDADIEYADFHVKLDHPATPADHRKYSALGFKVASDIYRKHCLKAIEADAEATWKETLEQTK